MSDTSSVVSPAALSRLQGQAASQGESASTQLALTPYEYGTAPQGINPTNPNAQDTHPSAQRLATSQWAGKTSDLNHAQASAGGGEVWVTVPVDKVTTTQTSAKVAPVYQTEQGYRAKPGESAGSIPPAAASAVGRPY
jgi:hypothetical protein